MATVVTKTVGPGKDYTTLAAFESGEQRNLVTADEIARALCSNFEDTQFVQFASWTTDATHYIVIEALDDHKSAGAVTTNAYRLTTTFVYGIDIRQSYTRIIGIQGSSVGSSSGHTLQSSGSATGVHWSYCVAVIDSASTSGIRCSTGDAAATNCMIYRPNQGNGLLSTGGALTAYSCTCIASVGQQSGGTVSCVNCYAAGRGISAYGFGVSIDVCASDDNTGTGIGYSLRNVPLDNTTFYDVAAFNFRLSLSGSKLQNIGNDTSNEPYPFDFIDDILRVTRIGWSVGAYENPPPPPLPGRILESIVTCNVVATNAVNCKAVESKTI